MRYARTLPADASTDALLETEDHIRAHLSAAVDPHDDPDAYAEAVTVGQRDDEPGQITYVGELDMPADAPYLREGFDPDAETEPYTYQPWQPQGDPS